MKKDNGKGYPFFVCVSIKKHLPAGGFTAVNNFFIFFLPAWNFSFKPMKLKFLPVETKVSIRRNYLGTLFGDSKNAVTVLS